MKPFLVTRFIMTGDLKAATAEAAVTAREPPKYKYVVLIRSLTYCGQMLKKIFLSIRNYFFFTSLWKYSPIVITIK